MLRAWKGACALLRRSAFGPAGRQLSTTTAAESAGAGAETSASLVPWSLTVAGMVPFVALTTPGSEALGKVPQITQHVPGIRCVLSRSEELQRTYAASIVSFLGAVHWGVALGATGASARYNAMRYLWGVTPSLMAWGSLALPEVWCLGGLMGSLASCYAVDRVACGNGECSESDLPFSLDLSPPHTHTHTRLCLWLTPSRPRPPAKALPPDENGGHDGGPGVARSLHVRSLGQDSGEGGRPDGGEGDVNVPTTTTKNCAPKSARPV